MSSIYIEQLNELPVGQRQTEIVERKGKGHPDTICDAVMEEAALALNQYYLKNFGRIYHYNLDKGLLSAGAVQRKFGGGTMITPMKLIFGDRATSLVQGKKIPVEKIVIDAAKKFFRKNFRFINPEKHISFQTEIKPGSSELVDIFQRQQKILPANDTSALVGYAPLSDLEKLVLATEKYLNSANFKQKFPETGEDVKVMATRAGREVNLTVAMPFLDRFVKDEKDYFQRKKIILREIEEFLATHTDHLRGDPSTPLGTRRSPTPRRCKPTVSFNTLDQEGRGLNGCYLSVLGTSAEDADSGEVGRGNSVNGLIALNRPSSTEAAAGKNPASHVGKIYNILTHKMAEKISSQIEEVEQVYVWLCSQIGQPINQPKLASAQVILKEKTNFQKVSAKIEKIMQRELAQINRFCQELAEGRHRIY